ncbi:5-oxoprolinase subunit PxpB [Neotamlana laminarinivorans]|uniref:5-oxoprolinase subunit PxpB n=1 Tax=Neotamlana laminarinivorans TaxID=2883124 RepID=A0A9X1HXD1_9FLAO|nr:5-oxoprolinase subunit PxpB [Tamlana laminarinivorans]MCB4797316.1 5-oxoprolinase subunit PxpB [Tamlana laminarinivorans]
MSYNLTYKQFNERSILIEWPKTIDEDILNDVLQFKAKIKALEMFEITVIKHAYQSLLIQFKNNITDVESLITTLKSIYQSQTEIISFQNKIWKIPVCYDPFFGIDLANLANKKGLSIETVIEKHSQVTYKVYFIGFLPGFLYLGGLDNALETPRKATPRLQIEKGSVAIGGNQTGIYPSNSPGGWNIIGQTPINFFNVNKSEPCFARAGDGIKFIPVSKKEFLDIKTLVEHDVYIIESEVIND